MIIKEYDLEEEKRKYPYSIHLDLTDPTDIIPDEYFESRSDNDLMYLTRIMDEKNLELLRNNDVILF